MNKKVIVIGSGCAGLSCVDWLNRYGIDNILLITENINSGTSRNTGSDKQTYYKLSLCNSEDNIKKMAKDIYECGAINGENALVEACNSVRCFCRLVEYGVPFPCNEYGEFIGYKTDHDDSKRATSIGPYTSKAMTEVLEKAVKNRNIEILDKARVIKILAENKTVIGLLYYDFNDKKIKSLQCDNIVLATGGQSSIYKDSVYPVSQRGSISLGIDVGAKLSNFSEWQYGIASVKFRWNLSGSYQQVIPRYISIDGSGTEREFLKDYFVDFRDAYNDVFLKGYEWPFDSRKINGSSRIDMAVLSELKSGRKVFLDYRQNPENFNIEELPAVKQYLTEADALGLSPIDRLKKLNNKAVDLFLSNSIDLNNEILEISVCAQHCNGGLDIDEYFRTDVNGLFAIGEVSGNFGVYRPGGSALNSTQVGGLRVAEYLSRNEAKEIKNNSILEDYIEKEYEFIKAHLGNKNNIDEVIGYFQSELSKYGGILRDINELERLKTELDKALDCDCLTVDNPSDIDKVYDGYETLKAQSALINTILLSVDLIGSRGGAITYKNGNTCNSVLDKKESIVITDKNGVYIKKRTPLNLRTDNFELLLKNQKNYGDDIWQK